MSSASPSFSCIPKLLASALLAAMVFYLLNPAFYWQLARTAVHGSRSGGCSPCLCDCAMEASEESMLLPGEFLHGQKKCTGKLHIHATETVSCRDPCPSDARVLVHLHSLCNRSIDSIRFDSIRFHRFDSIRFDSIESIDFAKEMEP
jgi:hypothetical protein